MPEILRETLPWLRIDRRRIYAVGGSMGGQEALLLLAKYPDLLAGAVSFDAPTNMATRVRRIPEAEGRPRAAGARPNRVRQYPARERLDLGRSKSSLLFT